MQTTQGIEVSTESAWLQLAECKVSLILVFQLQDIVLIQKNFNEKIVIEMLAKVPSVLVCCSFSVSKNQI